MYRREEEGRDEKKKERKGKDREGRTGLDYSWQYEEMLNKALSGFIMTALNSNPETHCHLGQVC